MIDTNTETCVFHPVCILLYWPLHYAEGYIVFAFFRSSFVCSSMHRSVTFVEFITEVRENFSRGLYLTNYSSESIHIWTMGSLEGLLPCHEFWLQGLLPRGGTGGQNLGHLYKMFFFSTFLFWKQLKQIVGQTFLSLVTLTCRS